jgi:hypothetical protein
VCPLVNLDHLGCHGITVHHWYTELVGHAERTPHAAWQWW